MKKITAVAHSNLAFVKYWGKADVSLNLPLNGSISMNLSGATTSTTVKFDPALEKDQITIKGDNKPETILRVKKHLDRVRSLAGINDYANVISENSFPMGTGIASSASGMAALTLAATESLGLNLSQRELSILARLGSGSACRSIPSGFVEWLPGSNSDDSYALQIAPPEHWDIVDIAVAVTKMEKLVVSSDGHKLATKSSFWKARSENIREKLDSVRHAIIEKDFTRFGQEIETEALSFHAIALTSPHTKDNSWFSGIFYWTPETLELLLMIQKWRTQGLETYFTLDAGPTVHILCLEVQKADVIKSIENMRCGRDWKIIENHPAIGAYILNNE